MSIAGALWRHLHMRRRFARRGRDVRVEGRLWIHGAGQVEVGDGTRFLGGDVGVDLHPLANGCIRIGAGCRVHEGVSIEATELVQLGDRVTVGAWVKVLDNDFHPLRGEPGEQPPPEPVVIGDDVVIGARAIILPGARIENGARVAPKAVVRRRVRQGSLVSGNPARVVGSA